MRRNLPATTVAPNLAALSAANNNATTGFTYDPATRTFHPYVVTTTGK